MQARAWTRTGPVYCLRVLMSVLAEWCSLRTQFRGRGGPIVHAAEKGVTDDWKVALRSFDDVLN